MKKTVLVLLALVLALTACGPKAPVETSVPTESAESELYEKGHPAETATSGAVRAYHLERDDYYGILPMGEKLVLLSQGNQDMTVIQGDLGRVISQVRTQCPVYAELPSTEVSPMGMSYYDDASRILYICNPNLQVSQEIPMPEDIAGQPAVSFHNKEVYFVEGRELRALNLETGISRLVKALSTGSMIISQSAFDGDVLMLEQAAWQDNIEILFVESQTGRTVSRDPGLYKLNTKDNLYFGWRHDGQINQKIFGVRDQTPVMLRPELNLWPVLSVGGGVSAEEEGDSLTLRFYQLSTGRHTASVSIPGAEKFVGVTADSHFVWVLAQGEGGQYLFRWDPAMTPVSDDAIYTQTLFTAANPDEGGLRDCRERAEAMGKAYGVRIAVYEDAVRLAEKAEPEHQVPTIHAMLDALEPTLKLFPEGFLKNTIEGNHIRIGLVRSLPQGKELTHFYGEGDLWILLTPTADFQKDLIRAIGYGVDSHLLGNSRKLDTWNELNPAGFQYDSDYELNAQRTDLSLAEGENRAFVDGLSMSFPQEDRAAVFAAAMDPDSGDLFASPILQEKLLRLCKAIREAYEWEKKPDTFPWEQHLTESIAYVKK